MFTLAHLTDLHLGPLPQASSWRDYLGKRTIGAISWHRYRRFHHDAAISLAMTADIRAAGPDHVALTGDLVNIALAAEFIVAAKWLKDFGPPGWITVVPGNHDAYVNFPWANGAGLWADYMTGDMNVPGARQKAATDPAARAAADVAQRAIYRYSKWPTQAITYNLGKNAIVNLREAYKAKTGAKYSECSPARIGFISPPLRLNICTLAS